MPTNARRRHRLGTGGPWGTGLLLLGLAVTVQGFSYANQPRRELSPGLQALTSWIPIQVWATLWIAAGLYSVAQALTPPQSHWDVWPVIAVILVWAFAHGVNWAVLAVTEGQFTRAWTSFVAWGSLAALIGSWGRCINPPHE